MCVSCADTSRDEIESASTGMGDDTGEAGDDGDEEGEIRLDVGDGMGTAGDGGDGEMGCRGIDFLFVVDNSGSMKEEQVALAASFPGFVDTIEEKVAEFEAGDFHILVTDTDATRIWSPSAYCSLSCDQPTDMCSSDGGETLTPCAFQSEYGCMEACSEDLDNACDAGTCRELLQCGECGCELGAGKLDDQDQNPCNVEGGQRYIQHGQSNLHETFSCLAQVGIAGIGDERAAGATIEALSPDFQKAGGCNEGFIRDDAILVVTVITDEEDSLEPDGGSAGDPPDWYEAVIAAKHDDPEAVMMLGLFGDDGQPNAVCEAEDSGEGVFAERLHEWVTSFPRHVVGSVCEPSYDQFFDQAVDLIKDTCEVYVPPQG